MKYLARIANFLFHRDEEIIICDQCHWSKYVHGWHQCKARTNKSVGVAKVCSTAAIAFMLFLGGAISAQAQTPAPADTPVTQTWSMNVQGVALPGGKTSLAGVDAGMSFTPSPNLDLFQRNILSSDRSLVFNGGGLRYRLPSFSLAANNASQNVNFLRVQFSIAGTFGMAQVNGGNHYGFLVGPRVDYQLTKGGAWTTGGGVEYAHFPGYPVKAVVELGTVFHF